MSEEELQQEIYEKVHPIDLINEILQLKIALQNKLSEIKSMYDLSKF